MTAARRATTAAGVASDGAAAAPLTLGTAGHIDHGKTALVRALTGVDTDRLPEEQARGISIALGYAPLELPSGRRLSVVDVPGHERFVRTMVAGATGIDLFLMVIAADDGVMPQTREHAAVLRGLGVAAGVVALTKTDLAPPDRAREEAAELLPGIPAVAVSARTGAGIGELRAALDDAAAGLRSRARDTSPARLHIDRAFTIHGAGTVVTGTLWSGTIGRGDTLRLLPAGRDVRVRGVQVHDRPADRALAGQRVAVNLTGIRLDDVHRGDVLTTRDSPARPSYVLDVTLDTRIDHGTRVHVHHGTREVPARVAALGGRFHQLRLEQPLVTQAGDRIVLRRIAPPDTLGGGTILDPHARRHGPARDALTRLTRLEQSGGAGPPPATPADVPRSARRPRPGSQIAGGGPRTPARTAPPPPTPQQQETEALVRRAGHEPPLDSELREEDLTALREAGRLVRLNRTRHIHTEALAEVERRVREIIEAEGSITLPRLRDELNTSRQFAQALLERLDSDRITLRRGDERVLRRRR